MRAAKIPALATVSLLLLSCGGLTKNEPSTDASSEPSADAPPDTTSPGGGDASLEAGRDASADLDASTTADATVDAPNDATQDADAAPKDGGDASLGPDADATRAYWSSLAGYSIFSAPLDGDGGAPTLFFYDSNYDVQGIGLDANHLYYTEESDYGPIGQLPLDGGAATILSTNNGTEGVVSDGTYVYFTSANGDPPAYDGAVLRVPAAGGTVDTIATGNWPDSIAIDATSVYWASSRSGVVMRATPR
jgi:hypothetical protein